MIDHDARGEATGSMRRVETSSWRLDAPSATSVESPLVVVPTVHPRGDRRVVRCAQTALDEGFRVHFIWLGTGDDPSDDAVVSENLLPEPRSAWERFSRVRRIGQIAQELDAALWHIHDYYFLGEARRWSRRARKPVLYDVHEYYADYYSERLPVPSRLQAVAARAIELYQVRSARRLGAANVVAERMAQPFRRNGVPVTVSPNYPSDAQFRGLPAAPFAERWWRVIHTGTLTPQYGADTILELARRAAERSLPFRFSLLDRFPTEGHRTAFYARMNAMGPLPNLELLAPRPTHEMPALLATAGFGLSVITSTRQNEAAVASKLFEYVMSGLVCVVTDRRAQREFVGGHAEFVVADEQSADVTLDRMLAVAHDPAALDGPLASRAAAARASFTWEQGVAPGLRLALRSLVGADER
jgi:glycosyltransferase involved in cell wall biosynthesis